MIFDVAAVIINWNSWDQLVNCISAIERQTVSFRRIIIVDNASEELNDKIITHRFDRIEFIKLTTNEGFARGNNIALECLQGCDFVALVNPDACLEENWLQVMLEAAERHPETASFASSLVMANHPDRWDGLGDCYHISGMVWRDSHAHKRAAGTIMEREVFSACAASALYRYRVMETVEGFDEDFFCYVEDVDLGFRLRLLGYHCLLVPDAIAYHVGSATTGGKHSDFAVYHGHRNLVWAFVKNMPSYLFWILLPIHLLMNLLSIVLFTLRGQGGVVLRSKRDALKGIPLMWQKRKQIQSNRVTSVRGIWRVLDKRIFPLC